MTTTYTAPASCIPTYGTFHLQNNTTSTINFSMDGTYSGTASAGGSYTQNTIPLASHTITLTTSCTTNQIVVNSVPQFSNPFTITTNSGSPNINITVACI